VQNLLILAPAPIAAIASSRGSGIENLLTPDPREVWADDAVGSAASIDIDFGTARPIDTVFLGHVYPLAPATSWTITGGLAGYAELTLKEAGAARANDVVGVPAPALSHAFWHGAAVTVRYLRITIAQPAGAEALTAGVVLAGAAFVPTHNREWGSGRKPIDTSTVTPLLDGGFSVVDGVRKTVWSWTLGDLGDAELDVLYHLALNRGQSQPVLVVEDPEATAGLRRRLHYGLFQQFQAFERRSYGRTRWELTIEEWGGDEAAI